jgi:TPP-dependent pyruvate/acetoin dehydrogenase alpha subunit
MKLTTQQQLAMLRSMQTIRRFEERASDDFQAGNIYGVVH